MIETNYTNLNSKVENAEQNKISVIVSVYNIESYVERAVESICKQTYQNLEIILVDDGSTDESGKLCDKWEAIDSRIRVIHKVNGGLSSARNAGMTVVTGDYFAFVDGDDWIDSTMYEDMLRAIQTFDADIAICNYKEVSQKGVRDGSTEDIAVFEGREILEIFIQEDEKYNIQNAAWNKLYKRSLCENLQFPEGRLYEDIVYTTKLLAKSQRCVYVNKAYYNYIFDRSDSIMNDKKMDRILSDQVAAYREKGEFLKQIGEEKLFLTHQYFFYKRMLLHYLDVKREKPQGYPKFLGEIEAIITRHPIWEAYDGQPKSDRIRMKLFTISPSLFCLFTNLNENYIIPYKQIKNGQSQPLVVIQLSGGMGNQMFQYALYLQLKALGRNVKIDDATEYQGREARPMRLSVFDAKYAVPTENEMLVLTDSFLDMASRIRRKLSGRKTYAYEEKSQLFDPEVLEKKRAYLVGCWQSEKYFAGVKEQVKQAFQFKNIQLSDRMKQYEKQMQETNSVCVHIRRGDYLDATDLYGGICTPEYYEKAMNQMREWFPDCHFFFFTNDANWVKENYQGEHMTIVEGNDENAGYIDMYLMTQCKHYILANSSFSWWGAYLSKNPDKKVIAPKQWYQGRDCRDIYTEEMILY